MGRKITMGLIFAFAAAMAVLILPAKVQAQDGCTKFQALVQGSLPSPVPLVNGDTWGGPIYATLGGEILVGNLSGTEEASFKGTIGMGRYTTYKVCFGPLGPTQCDDSFTYQAKTAVWPVQPGKVGMGFYQANSAKIFEGTGRFQYASGNLTVAGPFMVWRLGTIMGRWNAQITGNICGVQAAEP